MARESKAHTRVIVFPRHHQRNKREENNKLNSNQGETAPTLPHEPKASGKRKRDDVAWSPASKHPRGTFVALPDDIMPDILLKLPAQSIIRFRSVCKLFYLVTNDPSFNHSYATRAAPALLFRTIGFSPNRKEGGNVTQQYSDLLLATSRHNAGDERLKIEVMKWTRINHKGLMLQLTPSCDGMLCFFVHREKRYYICNPLIGDWIPLPDSTHRSYRCSSIIGFYFHVPAGEYRLVSRLNSGHKKKGCLYRYEVLTLGSSEWRQIEDSLFDPGWTEAIPMHDRLYWASTNYIKNNDKYVQVRSITVFDTQVEEFSAISVPHGNIHTDYHLMKLGEGELGLCHVTKFMEMHVYILKDCTREVWVKQYTISLENPILIRSLIRSGFGRSDMPYIRPVMTVHDDQEIVFAFGSTPFVYGVFSFNTKLNKPGIVGVKHMHYRFEGQYIETPVSCHYLDKRRQCLHSGRD